MRYRKPFLIQAELGQLFGATSHEIGRWLIECGLRCARTKYPTKKAMDEGYCGSPDPRLSFPHWAWNPVKTVPELVLAGHELLPEPPPELVFPSELVGPFTVATANPIVVLDASGDFVAKTASAAHSSAIARLLNLADKHGKLKCLVSE